MFNIRGCESMSIARKRLVLRERVVSAPPRPIQDEPKEVPWTLIHVRPRTAAAADPAAAARTTGAAAAAASAARREELVERFAHLRPGEPRTIPRRRNPHRPFWQGRGWRPGRRRRRRCRPKAQRCRG